MAGQNPFVYQPGLHERAMQRDPREGFWGRSFRPQEDIELEPELDLTMPTPPARPVPPQYGAPTMARMAGANRPISTGLGWDPPDPSDLRPVQQAGGFNGRAPGRMEWDMSGGNAQTTNSALAGLEQFESEQFSPFSEFELSRLANRDAGTVAPGSNQVWQNKLSQLQDRRAQAEKFDRELAQAPQQAITALHPDIQSAALAKAQRDALPQVVTARGRQKEAEIDASSRITAANTAAQAKHYGDQVRSLDPLVDAIRAIRAKNRLEPNDEIVLRGLMKAYHDNAQQLGLPGFEEFDRQSRNR